jgi:hypothetical protein
MLRAEFAPNRATAHSAVQIERSYRIVRVCLGIFMLGLIGAGLTTFPLIMEVDLLQRFAGPGSWLAAVWPALGQWIALVYQGLNEISARYPFMLYGTDWLGFAHLMIAVAFIGPLRDPVRNVWVVEFGMLACLLLVLFALIFGPIRGIPFFWTIVDSSFGIVGVIPLVIAYRYTKQMAGARPAGPMD